MNIKGKFANIQDYSAVQLARKTYERWQTVNAPQLAAALAYHTIFSLAPLLIISIYIVGLVLGQSDVQAFVIDQINTLLGEEGTKIILSMIQNLRQGNSGLVASIIGLATLVFGATRVFNQLEVTLNILFESEEEESSGIVNLLQKRALSFGMMGGVSILLFLSLLFSTGLSIVKRFFMDVIPQLEGLLQVLNYAIPVVMATFLFAVIFKYLPAAHLTWRSTLVGGFLTAILFTIGQLIISYYLGNSSISSAYGAAGSLLVVLVWIYYSAHIFYFGAAFTKEYANWQTAKGK
ncbi:MAG TPA: YihY/virulence factor BrkB family protein [Anaerolineales bacterium]|nr:YihY/virulence factor BrkB family protein [Anaerolineales bacterium]